jgi:hypothetical protein
MGNQTNIALVVMCCTDLGFLGTANGVIFRIFALLPLGQGVW